MPEPAAGSNPGSPGAPAGLPHVELLHWPAQEDRRRLLAALGEPRILLLAPHTTPPTDVDDLEHWIPEGAEPAAIVRGVARLQDKILNGGGPVLDDDGLLWFRGRWTAVADSQLLVVDLLIRNYRRLVRHEELGRAYAAAGGGATVAARRALMHRVSGRLAQVGLKLHPVRRRGFILGEEPVPSIVSAAGTRRGPAPTRP